MNMFIKARELFERDFASSQEVKQVNASVQGGKEKAKKSQPKVKRFKK
ncbi:hypothetical protein [Pontibacillus marinus]|uniref:Uncharacterized protein n=1 Tax=Pontibacillus marinus BH030004 = DSM 16465 TaxID=1385511 RepID=A0A0A5GIR0_9BACI|nr:hypothetical protein [Pontibacillus marinus]KGX91909.1 hypothetical protein N783_00960 [Pontibacillus marinus BH030004 = DSM 16465]